MRTDNPVVGGRNQIGAIVVGVVLILITGLALWLTNVDVGASSQTTRTLLNSLAIAQSSALAIVVSVTLLNVQLVADRFSTELVKSSLRSSMFELVLFAFIYSIAFDLFLVYNIVYYSTKIFTSAVLVASAWALINTYFLYQFIFNSVGVLTPSNLITTITRHDPEEIADRTTAVRDTSDETTSFNNNNQGEPLYQLYVIITSSVGTINYNVVQKGLHEFRSLLEEAIENLDQADGRKLCREAFRYYPIIVEQCIKNGDIKQSEQAVRGIISLLETLENQTEDWHGSHFAGIRALFKIRNGTSGEVLIDNETIPSRLEHCPESYWTDERMEYVLDQALGDIDQLEGREFSLELISRSHASVISSEQDTEDNQVSDIVSNWEQEMEGVLTSIVHTHRANEPKASRQFLNLWPQLYQRTMNDRGSHREWLVTVIFELSVLHAAHHDGEYEAGKDALLNTLRAAQPENTRERIKTLTKLVKRQTLRRREVPILEITDGESNTETAYEYGNLAESMVSEAIDTYRQENWDTDKAIKFVRTQPRVVGDHIAGHRFVDAPEDAEYTLITDPETTDGQIIKIVIAEEINSNLIETLSLDGVSRYVCIGPLLTGDFDAPDIETIKLSLVELRPADQTSIYDYYDWT